MDEINRKRLEWVAAAGLGARFDEGLFGPIDKIGNGWGPALSEAAQAALDEIDDGDKLLELRHSADMLAIARWRQAAPGRELKQPDHTDLCVWLLDQHRAVEWRPIAEAQIPGPNDGQPEYWCFHCILQNARGIVGEGFARYATDNRVRGKKHIRVLRWYFGDGNRDSRVCHDPLYFQPLPQPRKD